MNDIGNSIIESTVYLDPRKGITDVINQKYDLLQVIKMFVDAGKEVAAYERDRTEESELRKICFSEENMTTLAKEMYSIDDFSWMRILEERLDELLNGLEENNRKNCRSHFLQILKKNIRNRKPEIYERSMMVNIDGNIKSIYEQLNSIEHRIIEQEQTWQHQRIEGTENTKTYENRTTWTLEHTKVEGIFGDKKNRKKDIIKLIDVWSKERKEYPGWYIPPVWKCKELDHKTRESGLLQSHSFVDIDIMFDFCYEFVWRCETSMHIYSSYERNNIRNIWDLYDDLNKDECKRKDNWKYIGFSLLRVYREIGEKNQWDDVFEKLKKCTIRDNKWRLKLQLEKLKSAYYQMDMNSMRRALSQCKAQKEDYEIRLQILGIRVELNDCEGIIDDILRLIGDIQADIKYQTSSKLYLESLSASSLQLLSLCVQGISDYNNEYERKLEYINEIENEIEQKRDLFDWYDWRNQLTEAILKWHVKGYESKEAFELNKETYVLIDSYNGCTEAYRFFRLLDKLALPLRCGYVNLLGDIEHPWMEAILELNESLGVFMLSRSNRSKIIETIIDRKYIAMITSQQAESILQFLITVLMNNIDELDELDERPIGMLESVLSNIPELLIRYSSRASQQMQERLLLLIKNLMEKDYLPDSFKMAQIWIGISEEVTEYVKAKMLNQMLQTKIVEHRPWYGHEKAIDIFDYYFIKEDIGSLIEYCNVESSTIENLLIIPKEYGYEWKTKVARLEMLDNLGLLNETQKVDFAKLLWSHVSSKTGLPDLDNLHLFAFEKMPCLDSAIPTRSLKSWFLSQNLRDLFEDKNGCKGTMGYIPYLQELTLLCDNSEPGYWSVDEAEILLSNIQNYWEILKDIWSNNILYETRSDEYRMRAIRMVETVAAILRNVDHVSDERVNELMLMVQEMKTFNISTRVIEIEISKEDDLILKIINDMRSMDNSITVGAYIAACEYIKAHPDDIRNAQALLDELFNVIRYCKMPGLSSALFTIQNLLYIKSSIMSEDNLELLDNILFYLPEHLQIESNLCMRTKDIIRAKKACVSIAFQLYIISENNIGKGVKRWKDIAEDKEEVNDVRREWVYVKK